MRTDMEREPLPSGVPLTRDNVDPTVAAIAAAGQLADWIKALINSATAASAFGGVFTLGGGMFGTLPGGVGGLGGFFGAHLTPLSTPAQVSGVIHQLIT
jgi:hypothetical protein